MTKIARLFAPVKWVLLGLVCAVAFNSFADQKEISERKALSYTRAGFPSSGDCDSGDHLCMDISGSTDQDVCGTDGDVFDCLATVDVKCEHGATNPDVDDDSPWGIPAGGMRVWAIDVDSADNLCMSCNAEDDSSSGKVRCDLVK